MALVGVRFSAWVAEWAHGWIATWLGAQLTADIRSNLYRRLEMLSLQFYDKRKVGSLISRATRDAGMLQDFLVDGLPYIVINGLMVFGILGFFVLDELVVESVRVNTRAADHAVGSDLLEAVARIFRQVGPGLVWPDRAHGGDAFPASAWSRRLPKRAGR